jgi:hypothetical protein
MSKATRHRSEQSQVTVAGAANMEVLSKWLFPMKYLEEEPTINL